MRWIFLTGLVAIFGCHAPASSDRDSLTILAPAAPGGGWDQTARAMQQVLRSQNLAPSTQVINVPGAGGIIGLAQFVSANEGDPGVVMVTGLIMLGAILTNDAPVTLEDVTPIARILGEYEVLVVPAGSPHETLEDFVTAWKENPGGVAIAGGSAGGTDHMLVGLLARALGVDVGAINYVPHSGGGESLASLLGGHVAAGVNGYAELVSFIEAGRLRPLAISSEERVEGVNIATFMEQGVDVSLANWRAVAAPPGISDDDRAALVALMDRMVATESWQETLRQNQWIDLYLTGPAYEDFLKKENTRVAEVLETIGLVD